jgi:hypothetical protein
VADQKADRHKMDAIPYRPATADDLAWLRRHAAAAGQAVVDVLRQAVAEYRARHDQGQEQQR